MIISSKPPPPNRFQILSLDGGGLKGLFSVSFLEQLEEDAGKPCHEMFDLICGTSTGGIIALGLGLGIPAAQIKKFYLEDADQIFSKTAFSKLKQAVTAKYGIEGLNEALAKHFGNCLLGESKTRLLIPATHADRQEVYIYKTSHHEHLTQDCKVPVTNVARATSAAPTYFDPMEQTAGLKLVDGGIWANNPLMLGIAEALGYLNQSQENVYALRLGTTDEIAPMGYYPDKGGALALAMPILDLMMKVQVRSATSMAQHLLGYGDRLIDVNPPVSYKEFKLDILSENLCGLAAIEYRKASTLLHKQSYLTHQAPPYSPHRSVTRK